MHETPDLVGKALASAGGVGEGAMDARDALMRQKTESDKAAEWVEGHDRERWKRSHLTRNHWDDVLRRVGQLSYYCCKGR